MKGETLYKILDLLQDKTMEVLDICDVLLNASHGSSFSKFDYEHKIKTEDRLNYQLEREKRRRLEKYISKLKSQGLIDEISGKISLSVSGKKRLSHIKGRKLIDLKNYKKELGDKVMIISYDIPILFNRERNLLREILKTLGFTIVHKSVWVGKVKLPKQFVVDLERLGILENVEILEVSKTGSLKSYN